MKVRYLPWILLTAFVGLRLLLALRMPIFNDEATYMRWGLVFLARPDSWGQFMLDGKQPGVAALFGISELLPIDPLLSMRLVSVAWSVVTFFGILACVDLIYGKKYRLIISLLAIFCPFLMLFDTLAIAESAVVAMFVWALYGTLRIVRDPTLINGLFLGVAIGVGWWFKSTIFLSVPLIAGTCAIVGWHKGEWQRYISPLVVSLLVVFLFMAPIFLNPAINIAKSQTIQRFIGLSDIGIPLVMHWGINWISIIEWFLGLATPLLVAAIFLGVPGIWRDTYGRVLLLWFVGPMVFEAFFLTSISARLLSMTIPILLLLFGKVMNTPYMRKGLYVVVGSVVFFGILLAVSPVWFYYALTPFPAAQGDYSQYVKSWPSGWGVKEAIDYVRAKNSQEPVIVFTRLDGGNPEDAVQAYMQRYHIRVLYIDYLPLVARSPQYSAFPKYFISRGPQYAGIQDKLVEVAKFPKPLDEEFVGVYKIVQ